MIQRGQRLHTSLGVVAATIGVRVYSGVTGQLVRPAEAFRAPRERARVRFLSRMGANVSRLMLQPVESLFAQRTFVRSRHFPLTLLRGREIPIGDRLRHYGGRHFLGSWRGSP